MKLASVTVKLQLPSIGGIEGNWQPDERERDAAWEMYVELITRIAVVELRPDEGLIREALTSLYSLFDTTWGILRKYGPSIAKSKHGSDLSFGYIAVSVLNGLLRPLLAKWHPLLADHEARRDPSLSPVDHERQWAQASELRHEIEITRQVLREYADILAEVAGIEPLPWPQATPKPTSAKSRGATTDKRGVDHTGRA